MQRGKDDSVGFRLGARTLRVKGQQMRTALCVTQLQAFGTSSPNSPTP